MRLELGPDVDFQIKHDGLTAVLAVDSRTKVVPTPTNSSPRFVIQREGAIWSQQRDSEPKEYGALKDLFSYMGKEVLILGQRGSD